MNCKILQYNYNALHLRVR